MFETPKPTNTTSLIASFTAQASIHSENPTLQITTSKLKRHPYALQISLRSNGKFKYVIGTAKPPLESLSYYTPCNLRLVRHIYFFPWLKTFGRLLIRPFKGWFHLPSFSEQATDYEYQARDFKCHGIL